MMQLSLTNTGANTTLHVLADNATAWSLSNSLAGNCTFGNTSLLTPQSLNFSDFSAPVPEQAIQYYRASSVVLTLDGYNNTAALTNDTSAPDTPLPTTVDGAFIMCVNETIGNAVPLIGGTSTLSPPMHSVSGTAALGLVLLWLLF